MTITPEDVHLLAADARLAVTDEEMPGMIQYLENFLQEMNRMNELQLDGVPEFDFPEAFCCPLREDVAAKFDGRDDILSAAPHRDGDYYRVPRIMEG